MRKEEILDGRKGYYKQIRGCIARCNARVYSDGVLRRCIARVCYLGSHECNALVPLDDDEAVSKHELPESARERGRGVEKVC